MAQELHRLAAWLTIDDWPRIDCPTCVSGVVRPEVLSGYPSAESARAQDQDGWWPGETSGVFHGLLRCSRKACNESVAVVGDYSLDEIYDRKGNRDFVEIFRARYFEPPLAIIEVPKRTPKVVVKGVEGTARLTWSDPAAAGNRLRVAVDELLTAEGMRRYRVVNHKRIRLTTHARIQEFRRYASAASQALEAVKWIANEASHTSSLTTSDVLVP